ncbi:MAG: chain length determinant protein tyrosine kinase EpsG [Rhodocyclaceae bacterium]
MATSRSIGAILVDAGRLSPGDAERVLRLSREKNIRFGDAALELRLITEADISFALSRQFDYICLPPGDKSVSRDVVAAFSLNSRALEGLRALRTQLMLRWFAAEQERKALAIVSSRRKDGRSWIAANLAVVFSQLGERTLLIDADMRHPVQHEHFHLDNRAGLSALLSGRGGDELIRRVESLQGLSVLPAGVSPPNAQELISRPAFGQLVSHLSSQFDVILVDTPPASEFADAQAVAASTRGALMVARRHHTSTKELREAAEFIAQTGASIVGSAMNEF